MHGSSEGVLEFAIATLANNGFAITYRDATSATLTGPGLNSTRQNPILGASRITLVRRGSTFYAEAELGGVDTMQRFLMWFPFLLGLGLGLFFCVGGGLIFGRQMGVAFGVPWAPGWQWMVVAMGGAMLPVAPWLILSPLMVNMIRKRTQNAIETLVHNAVLFQGNRQA